MDLSNTGVSAKMEKQVAFVLLSPLAHSASIMVLLTYGPFVAFSHVHTGLVADLSS